MHYFTSALAILALSAVVIFSIQNIEATDVSFLFWSVNVSKVLVIVGAYLLGMITGGAVVSLVKRLMKKKSA